MRHGRAGADRLVVRMRVNQQDSVHPVTVMRPRERGRFPPENENRSRERSRTGTIATVAYPDQHSDPGGLRRVTVSTNGDRVVYLCPGHSRAEPDQLWVYDVAKAHEQLVASAPRIDGYATDQSARTAVYTSAGRLYQVDLVAGGVQRCRPRVQPATRGPTPQARGSATSPVAGYTSWPPTVTICCWPGNHRRSRAAIRTSGGGWLRRPPPVTLGGAEGGGGPRTGSGYSPPGWTRPDPGGPTCRCTSSTSTAVG